MNTPAASKPRSSLAGLLLAALALGLVAYYFWPRPSATDPATGNTDKLTGISGASSSSANGPLPPGAVSNVGGIPLDANGNRILNSAGLPISNEPLPEAKAIPIKAPAGTVIGYTKDAQGNSQPLRAGDLKQIPNTPGSYAVVDMWADGGPAVVPPTQGKHLTDAEVKRLRDQERAREQAASAQP